MEKKASVIFLIFLLILIFGGSVFFIYKYFNKSDKKIFQINSGKKEEFNQNKTVDQNIPNITNTSDIQPEITSPAVENKTVETNVVDNNNQPESGNSLKIADNLVDFGFKAYSSKRFVDTVVIHSSYYDVDSKNFWSIPGILSEYKRYGVAAHYIIDREGKIYRLVQENDIAYQAGVSQMPDGRKDVNGFSIGIELVNNHVSQFSDAEYAALNNLIKDIKSRYGIEYIVGHNQIAPDRRTDPWNFDWKRLTK